MINNKAEDKQKLKLLYISSIAAPHQIKLSNHLKKYFKTEFWFYDLLGNRDSWWSIPLPKHCKVLRNVKFKKSGRYYAKDLITELKMFNPDILMLGGFFIPSNYLAFRWAKKNGIKTIVFTETFRKNGKLRKQSVASSFLNTAYKGLDAVFTSNEDATLQMKTLFPSLKTKIFTAYYASDIDSYFEHPLREKKIDNGYVFLFPNRLTSIYNPLLAVDIFSEIVKQYPFSKLKMNAKGELRQKVENLILELNLKDKIKFLDNIKSWKELPLVYKNSDILIFPAIFSNGNFSIYEAMASGMGIIISNKIKGNTKLLKNGKSCFICNPDKKEFIEAAKKYIQNPELLKIHAKINRKIVWGQSAEAVAQRYANLIYNIQNL